jgi:hypothetical protein
MSYSGGDWTIRWPKYRKNRINAYRLQACLPKGFKDKNKTELNIFALKASLVPTRKRAWDFVMFSFLYYLYFWKEKNGHLTPLLWKFHIAIFCVKTGYLAFELSKALQQSAGLKSWYELKTISH